MKFMHWLWPNAERDCLAPPPPPPPPEAVTCETCKVLVNKGHAATLTITNLSHSLMWTMANPTSTLFYCPAHRPLWDSETRWLTHVDRVRRFYVDDRGIPIGYAKVESAPSVPENTARRSQATRKKSAHIQS